MENPHAERQAVLLERILKNTSKCTETILELNHCMEVRDSECASREEIQSNVAQEIIRANAQIRTAADLSKSYRRNVQYNLEATNLKGKGDASGKAGN